jgi:PhnB protein
MSVSPYVTFDGNGAEALRFYAQVFETDDLNIMTFGDSPEADQFPQFADQLMHGNVAIEGGRLMASDATFMPFEKAAGISVQVSIADVDRAKAIFERLAEGGNITMEWHKPFWGNGFGSCVDHFGVPWLINCE